MDVDGLVDHRGRPLSEIYFTVIKRNKGHEAWYESGDTTSSDIEFSHCFSKVTSGLDLPVEVNDYNVRKLHNIDISGVTDEDYTEGMSEIFKDFYVSPDVLEDDITMLVVRYLGKEGALVYDTEDSAQERITDHSDSFDADSLIDNAIDENVSDSSINVEPDEVVEQEEMIKQQSSNNEENDSMSDLKAGEFTSVIEGSEEDFAGPDSFDDDMFSGDFSNPNADLTNVAGISVDDIVDPDVFEDIK